MTNALDMAVLRLVVAEPGEWAPARVIGGNGVIVCDGLARALEVPVAEVQAARERLVRAELLAPSRVRLLAWPRSCLHDLHRAILARVGISPPAGLTAREIATALDRAKPSGDPDGGLADALEYLYLAGHLSPPSALWPTAAGVALVQAEDAERVAA